MIAALVLILAAAPAPARAQGACVRLEELTPAKSIDLPKLRWSPEIHARLLDLIRRRGAGSAGYDPCKRPLAVFDWDNTIIFGDIGDQAFNTAVERGMFKHDKSLLEPLPEEQAALLDAAWKEAPKSARALFHRAYEDLCSSKGNAVCYPWIAQLFQGHSLSSLETFSDQLIKHELERELITEKVEGAGEPIALKRGVRVRPEMQSLIEALQKTGFDVFVITASPEWLIQVFAPKIGVPRENVIGMRVFADAKGVLSPRVDPPITYRVGKVAAIRSSVPPGGRVPVLALGDAETDWEMLDEATDLAVLIDRNKPDLKAHGAARGWAIQPLFER